MKKFLSVFAILLCLITPAFFMVGCNKNNNASNVKNRAYYVSVAKRDSADLTDILETNLRITFYDDYFKLEKGDVNKKGYGSYSGKYEAKGSEVTLTITDYQGDFADKNVDPILLSLSPLKYENGILKVSFIYSGDIYQFEFSTKK